jgi:hypothetical protein
MRKFTTAILIGLSITACTAQQNQSLSEKLSETTNYSERKQVLYDACLTEAEWPVYSNKSKQAGRLGIKYRQEMRRKPEITGMINLCEQMNNSINEKKGDLSASCASKVESKKEKNRDGWDEHATRIETICTEMLNLKTTN